MSYVVQTNVKKNKVMNLKTLKNLYAQVRGYDDWDELANSVQDDLEYDEHWTEICIRAQKKALEKAAEKLQQIENVKKCVKEFGVCEYGFLVYDEFMKNEDFKFFSKDFPSIYDKHFKKFITKIQSGNISIFSIKEIPLKEKNHQDIMNRLIKKIGVKKHELEGIPLQNAKSEIVENYLKQC